LDIVSSDPVDKGKQAGEVLQKLRTTGKGVAKPFPSSRLMLNVRIRRVDGEDALASCDTVRSSFVAVMQVDTEDLGQAMADLAGCSSHNEEWVPPLGGAWRVIQERVQSLTRLIKLSQATANRSQAFGSLCMLSGWSRRLLCDGLMAPSEMGLGSSSW
jgi:hypothetical protein